MDIVTSGSAVAALSRKIVSRDHVLGLLRWTNVVFRKNLPGIPTTRGISVRLARYSGQENEGVGKKILGEKGYSTRVITQTNPLVKVLAVLGEVTVHQMK